jgi:hypothetical protein
MSKNGTCSFFVILVTFERKRIENSASSHFTQNFALYKMAISKNVIDDCFWNVKNATFGISGIFLF